jgi:hypothetical protein
MFYKLDPTLRKISLDLAPDGFRVGDRLWVQLKGDFQYTWVGEDKWRNTSFEINGREFSTAAGPAVVKAKDTILIAHNHDDPLEDNSDPDNDYGVRVKIVPWTSGDDVFRFKGRDFLPEIQGSIYKAGGGNDVVYMPDAPVDGFDTGRTFSTGAGNDRVVAGSFDQKIAFGGGVDTFILKGDTFFVPWANKENRDNDDKLVIRTSDHKHKLVNVEVLKDDGGQDPGVKWYFDLKREGDGDLTVKFFENGKLVTSGTGHYDEALPTPAGQFQAAFGRGGWMGERVEITGVSGYGDIAIHKGNLAGNTEADFVVAPSFLKTVFNHVEAAYASIGTKMPWSQGRLEPLVPVTAAVRGNDDQPLLKPKDVDTSDHRNAVATPKFVLWSDGDVRGLDDKSIQIFFTATGSAQRFQDWNFQGGAKNYTGDDFAGGVLRHGKNAAGDVVYSVMLEQGTDKVAVPLKIFGDDVVEGTERVRFEVVDIDIWRHVGTSEKLYHVSGGPGTDSERDFDGPTGLENSLVQDTALVVTIHDNLIG